MRTGLNTPGDLIATGGWRLDDAQARHAANPDTFWMPSPEQLAAIVPGSTVRLIFQVADQADPVVDGLEPYAADGRPNLVVGHERMWLYVEEVGAGFDDDLIGVLMNQPVASYTRLVPGARVRFKRRDVIDLDNDAERDVAGELADMAAAGFPVLDEADTLRPEDPNRDPTLPAEQAEVCARYRVRPERPAPGPFSLALVGKTLFRDTWPVYGLRFRPNPERSDTGWSVWTGPADMDEAAKTDGFEQLPTGIIQELHEGAWAHLALPPGWGFVLYADGTTDVYQDPALLE